jgi:hypothetical protein
MSLIGTEQGPREYSVRYVHKIAPRDTDVGPAVRLGPAQLADPTKLAATLRKSRILFAGGRIRDFRVEPSGRVIVFPSVPGMTTYWHSIILTPLG